MSHIIYCDESAEQSQVIGDSVRKEASTKGSYVIKRQIIWGRPNNPGAAARRELASLEQGQDRPPSERDRPRDQGELCCIAWYQQD